MRVVSRAAGSLQRAVELTHLFLGSVLADGPGGWVREKKKSGVLVLIGVNRVQTAVFLLPFC
jgi:hypothetical protein